MGWTIGVDVGGTFTDFYAANDESGQGPCWKDILNAVQSSAGHTDRAGCNLWPVQYRLGGHCSPVAWHDCWDQRTHSTIWRYGRIDHHQGLSRFIGKLVARPDHTCTTCSGIILLPWCNRENRIELEERMDAQGDVVTEPTREAIDKNY